MPTDLVEIAVQIPIQANVHLGCPPEAIVFVGFLGTTAYVYDPTKEMVVDVIPGLLAREKAKRSPPRGFELEWNSGYLRSRQGPAQSTA